MKRRFVYILILALGFFSFNLFAQTPPTTNNQTKTPTTPVKKWRPRTITQTGVALPGTTQTLPVKQADTVKNTDFTLSGQYQFLLSRSRSINGYKLVNPNRLNALWKSVKDTIAKERIVFSGSNKKITAQQKTIDSLQNVAKGNEALVNNTNAQMDEITFLGMSFNKGTYNLIVWGLILALAIALFVVIARSAKNILEAKHRTQLYDEVSAEFQTYKAKANEKERKLARELQDERNLIEELKSNKKG